MYRKSLREQTFKLLFRIEFNSSEEMTEQEELFFNNDDITFSEKDRTEIEKKYADVIKNLPAIDKELSEVAASSPPSAAGSCARPVASSRPG